MSIENIKISVIVATYNQSTLLERCIDSILKQESSAPYSIHIVNDASTDDTGSIIEKYKKEYPEKVHATTYTTNQYQNGFPLEFPIIQNLECSHIAFCDGDDYWLSKDKLELQVREFGKNPELSIVHTGYLFGALSSNGEVLQRRKGSEIEKSIGVENALDFIKGNEVKKSTAMFRKSALDMNFLTRCYGIRAQDWLVCACASLNGPIKYLEQETTVYTISPLASYQSLDVKTKLEIKDEVRWYCAAYIPNKDVRNEYRDYLLREMLRERVSVSKVYIFIRPIVIVVRKIIQYIKNVM